MPKVSPIPPGHHALTPYLIVDDAAGAIAFYTRAFGAQEVYRMPGPDGRIMHAEMECADGVVMLGCPGPDYRSPQQLGQATQSLYVYVDEVDKHHRHARECGAKILEEPQDQFYGDRRYGAEDPEGHHWYFAQHVREVAPEDMKPPA